MLAMPLFRAASLRYPNIMLHLHEELTGNRSDHMRRGRADVAVFTAGMAPGALPSSRWCKSLSC